MAIPPSKEARLYYRSAFERADDADTLHRAGRLTGAVYLAGYGIECILKALILAETPAAGRTAVLQTFRGNRGHDFNWLVDKYYALGGSECPRDIFHSFTLIGDWTTDMRYEPGKTRPLEAAQFLQAAARILTWADGRL